jgi:hypothetical protein
MPVTTTDRRNMIWAVVYFGLSTLITWWFIEAGKGLYADKGKMMLSCAVAGGKWGIQILAAVMLLGEEKRWAFLRRIGMVCLAGSVILLPFCFEVVQVYAGERGFLYSLAVCVLLMIGLYYLSVRWTGISMRWFWGWIVCLIIAISLQLTVVFGVVG